MTTSSPEFRILAFLARRTHASAVEVGRACAMAPPEVRARLVMLESMRLVFAWSDPDASRTTPRRVYAVTGEGRRRAGMSDARTTT